MGERDDTPVPQAEPRGAYIADARHAGRGGVGHDSLPPDWVALFHRSARKLEHARLSLAEARASASAHEASARDSLRKLQDAQAEVFRLREQLDAARRDADIANNLRLDLDSELRTERARAAELHARNNELDGRLHQLVELHAQAGTWRSVARYVRHGVLGRLRRLLARRRRQRDTAAARSHVAPHTDTPGSDARDD